MKKQTAEKKEKTECKDQHCPKHGQTALRGRTFEGKITSSKMHRTANFELERTRYIQKYQRYERLRTVLKAHNSDCVGAKEGDSVRIKECRPISKTKKFIITEVLKN